MPIFDRSEPAGARVVDRWEDGVGWLAHPDEAGRRASHAVRGEDGVWLFDPLDAPGVDDLVADLGEVAGVAVFSSYHARDAGALADRYGVPVHLPEWMGRVEARLDAPVERYATRPGASGFEVRRLAPLPGWGVGIAYREVDRTLYVPDVLGTAPTFTVGGERLGVHLVGRLFPPRGSFAGLSPARIVVGHGEGVFDGAAAALDDALSGARRRLPRALVENGPGQLRAALAAVRG